MLRCITATHYENARENKTNKTSINQWIHNFTEKLCLCTIVRYCYFKDTLFNDTLYIYSISEHNVVLFIPLHLLFDRCNYWILTQFKIVYDFYFICKHYKKQLMTPPTVLSSDFLLESVSVWAALSRLRCLLITRVVRVRAFLLENISPQTYSDKGITLSSKVVRT